MLQDPCCRTRLCCRPHAVAEERCETRSHCCDQNERRLGEWCRRRNGFVSVYTQLRFCYSLFTGHRLCFFEKKTYHRMVMITVTITEYLFEQQQGKCKANANMFPQCPSRFLAQNPHGIFFRKQFRVMIQFINTLVYMCTQPASVCIPGCIDICISSTQQWKLSQLSTFLEKDHSIHKIST